MTFGVERKFMQSVSVNLQNKFQVCQIRSSQQEFQTAIPIKIIKAHHTYLNSTDKFS